MPGTVLLDTNVFTAWLKPRSTLVPLYGRHVFGRRIAIAQQTVAEARYGALVAGWGVWIAAAAIRWQLPLVAHDAVYVRCPGVELLTELSA